MLCAIDVKAFLDSLPMMGLGMLGIFVVTAIIVASIYVLNWASNRKN